MYDGFDMRRGLDRHTVVRILKLVKFAAIDTTRMEGG